LLKISTIVGPLAALGVLAFELNSIYGTASGALTQALFAWILIKTGLFILAFVAIWKCCHRSTSPVVHFNGFLSIFTLFGVLFSLYLTDIELFVLKAICIYCLTQQILIAIIVGLSIVVLMKNKNAKQ
jgi:uncharacterized membrane protein